MKTSVLFRKDGYVPCTLALLRETCVSVIPEKEERERENAQAL